MPRRIEMLQSPAFRALSLAGRRILDRLEIEFGGHAGKDNGRLPVTFSDLEEFGITDRHGIGSGIRELQALGFVELTRRGRSGNGMHRSPNLFRITYLAANGTEPTDEWQQIRTIEDAKRIAQRARRTIKKHRRRNKFPSGGIHTGTGVETTPATSGGIHTETPNSPVVESTPLSREDLAICCVRQAMRPGQHPSSRRRSSKPRPAKSLNQGRPCHGKGE